MKNMLDMDIATKMGELAAKAYIDVYGLEKWNSLSVQQQHDAIMYVLTDIYNRLS